MLGEGTPLPEKGGLQELGFRKGKAVGGRGGHNWMSGMTPSPAAPRLPQPREGSPCSWHPSIKCVQTYVSVFWPVGTSWGGEEDQ